jgi:hypothetical protein
MIGLGVTRATHDHKLGIRYVQVEGVVCCIVIYPHSWSACPDGIAILGQSLLFACTGQHVLLNGVECY